MTLKKRICAFLLVLAALTPITAVGVGQYQFEAPVLADGGAPEPPPIPVPWPWLA